MLKSTLCTLLAMLAPAAFASLDGNSASVDADALKLGATSVVQNTLPGFVRKDMTLPSQTHVREYVDGAGHVFAVSWTGPVPPDLHQLLGDAIFAQYLGLARSAPGRHPVMLESGELVIHAGGAARHFFGQAFLPGRLPIGVGADAIQ